MFFNFLQQPTIFVLKHSGETTHISFQQHNAFDSFDYIWDDVYKRQTSRTLESHNLIYLLHFISTFLPAQIRSELALNVIRGDKKYIYSPYLRSVAIN